MNAHVQTARSLTISIREGKAGVFFASSEDEPTFFVSALSMDEVWAAIPCALEHMSLSRDHLKVRAIPTDKGDFANRQWTLVPTELLAAHSATA
jgi:hypothetical protein